MAGALAASFLIGLYAAYTVAQRIHGRRNIAVGVAATASGVMMVTIAMRIISLHAMDRLLYGPLKLNWIGDVGSSFFVIAAAIYYVMLVTGRLNPGRNRG